MTEITKKQIKCLLSIATIAIILCIPLIVVHAGPSNKLELTSEELQWLEKHKDNIRYAPSPNYPPIGFVENGKPKGITAEYIRIIEERLNISFEIVHCDSWNEIIKKARLGEVDMVGNIQDTPARRKFLRFTNPYVRIPNSIIIRKDFKETLSPSEMDGMRVAIVKGYSSLEFVKTKYPKIIIVPVKDNPDGLQMVSFGRADAMITDLAVASYFIDNLGITNLRVAGSIDYVWDLCFATRKDLPQLTKIIEKSLNTISNPDRLEIKNKWISLIERGWRPGPQFWITLSSLIVFFLIAAFFVWNLTLQRKVKVKTINLHTELTERKLTEEALRNSNEMYRSLFENTGTATFVTEEDMTISQVNAKCEALSGYSKDEIVGKMKTTDFIPVEELERIKRYHFERRKKDDDIPSEYEMKLIDKNQNIRNVFIQVGLIPKTKQSIASIIDITERKRAEEALLESEDKYRQLFEMESDAIFLIRKNDGKILEVNSSGIKLYGFKREELLKMKNTDLSAEPDDTQKATMEKRREIPVRYHRKKDGTVFPVEITASHFTWKGQEVHLAAIRDITSRIEAEKEKAYLEEQLQHVHKMEAIGTLAGGIAHQFNNALSGILGNIEMLMWDLSDDENIRRYVEPMKDSAQRMSNLTSQLLAYARGGKYQAKTISLNDFIRDTLPLIEHTITSTVFVETDLPMDVMPVKADVTQMQMVLSAVLTNASEAMEGGRGRVRISTRNKEVDVEFSKSYPGLKPGTYICLTVEDDGKGMDETTKSCIFDPFFTTQFHGRGLGMAAVYGIIKNHDGWISVDSELEVGTTVRIYIPALELEKKETKKEKLEPVKGTGTILVIEDEQVVMDVNKAMLERLGYQVLGAMTGKEAIAISKNFDGDIHLALLDIVLPDMSGKDIYPQLMKTRPNMKVIICSGYSIDGPAQEILDEGAQDFIQKPFSLSLISEKLNRILGGK